MPLIQGGPLQPGSFVRWRDPDYIGAIGWADAYGTGPFEVVRVEDRSALDIPEGVFVKTLLGVREINLFWLVSVGLHLRGLGD